MSVGMARILLIALALLLVGCGGAGPGDLEPLPRSATVLAFGDSVTSGTGAAEQAAYPSHLEARTGWTVINAGVPGARADSAGKRLRTRLEEHGPDLVLLWLGGNDFLRRREPAAVKEDLRALVRQVRASGAQPLLLGVPAASVLRAATGRLRDHSIYRELAREEDVPLIEGVLSEVLSRPELRADAIHPNARGYRRIASEIALALDDLGLWLAP